MKWALGYILAGGVLSLVLRAFAPLEGAGPIAGSFEVLPLVAGLFAAAQRAWPGAARLRTGAAWSRLAFATGLLLTALAQGQSGIRYSDVLVSSIIFASLVGLIAWQAYDSLRALVGADRFSRHAAFFLVVLAVYAGLTPWSTALRPPDGDEPYYLLLTHSLAYDFDADLANNYAQEDSLEFMPRAIAPQPGDPTGPAGQQFSRHNVMLPLVMAPFYRLAGLPGAVAVMVLLAAALSTVVLRISDLYYPKNPKASLLAASVMALCPPLLLQSNQLWVEVPAALLVAIGFEGAARLELDSRARAPLVQTLLAALLLPLLKLRFLALAAPILGLGIVRSPRSQRSLLLRGLGLLLALAMAILLFNQASFGQALKHHSARSLLVYFASPVDYLKAPLGLLVDSSFGLLFTAPIWILVFPGAWLTLRRRRDLFVSAGLVCAPYLLLLGPRPEWYGGWSPFFRYGMVFLPFAALLLTPVMADRGRRGIGLLIAILAVATACLTMIWLVIPGWTYNFADGRGYLLDHLTVILGTDMARLFPSEVRPRAANLVWLVLLVLLSSLARSSRACTRRIPFAEGVTIVLLGSAGLVLLGTTLPTRVIEFEDPYVEKHGGQVWPDQWKPSRVAYRGSWELEPGDQVVVPIRPGGTEFVMALDLRRLESIRSDVDLEVLADGTNIVSLKLPPARAWSTVRLDPIPWPPGTRSLSFRLAGQTGRVLLDRARLDWR